MKSLCAGMAVLAATFVTGGTFASAEDGITEITGSFAYRERIALLPGATGIVTLQDVSKADAAATILAEETLDLAQMSMPYDYTLEVPTSELEANHMYSVRAVIRNSDGSLMWTTDTANLIDPTAGDQELPMFTLVRVSQSGGSEGKGDMAQEKPMGAETVTVDDLASTTWRVIEINGTPTPEGVTQEIAFTADGGVSGMAGCNRFTGSYSVESGKIGLGELAMTRKACVPAVGDAEARFAQAFSGVLSLSKAGDQVIFTNPGGERITVVAGAN